MPKTSFDDVASEELLGERKDKGAEQTKIVSGCCKKAPRAFARAFTNGSK